VADQLGTGRWHRNVLIVDLSMKVDRGQFDPMGRSQAVRARSLCGVQ